MKLCGLILMALLMVPVCLPADDSGGNTEVTIHSGWSFLDAEKQEDLCPFCLYVLPGMVFPFSSTVTTTAEDSLMFGFKVGYYLNNSMELEGGFSVTPNHNVHMESFYVCPPDQICPMFGNVWYPFYAIDKNMVSYQYDINFVYNIGNNDIKPFLSFGVGGVASDFLDDVKNDFAFNFSGGAKFYFKGAGLRFEVNDHVIPDYFLTGETEHDLQIQYGFLFRLP